MLKYNTTQLSPDKTFERHVFHRDQFAHYLRWSHVLKRSKIGNKVLDIGCGSGNLLEVLYRNRFRCSRYIGLDIRKKTIDNCSKKFLNVDWAKFYCHDITAPFKDIAGNDHDIITCFEVIEHVNKENSYKVMRNIRECMNGSSVLLLSTPVFDEDTGAAKNHIIDGIVQEFTLDEIRRLIYDSGFKVKESYGTFASKKDIKPAVICSGYGDLYSQFESYYDSNILSVLFSPLYPEKSRNIIWVLEI